MLILLIYVHFLNLHKHELSTESCNVRRDVIVMQRFGS
uniref:Uncharacterized protein n=1 Tax=Anguilla anguilla TaxID=7936 RepID=A0A0E9UTQ4_ANGAN